MQVYVLNGTDPEGDPIRYGLTFEKGSTEYFRVDPKSGNVTLVLELDREVSPSSEALHLSQLWIKVIQIFSSSETR